MNKTDLLKSYLPAFLFSSNIINSLFEQYGTELQKLDDDKKDMINQLFPQTATWSLDSWEQFCGLPINKDIDVEIRRSKVMAAISAYEPMTPERMKVILKHYAQYAEITQDYANYKFDATLVTKNNFLMVLSDVIREIERAKPAHLEYGLGLRTDKYLNIKSSYSRNINNPYPICGEIICGEVIV